MILFLLACGAGEAPVEALVVPEAPGESAMPVGVRTIDADGQRFELWYPAPEGTEGDSTEDFQQFVPQALLDHVGAVPFPTLSLGATRDAPVRNAGEPLPVVLFSHGLGGFRLQSFSFAAHLAARGHVVLAPDHPGRMMGDLLPCMFSPALEGCDLSGMLGEDPALEDLAAALTWIESAPEGFAFDTDRVALAGHRPEAAAP
jgi:predicted dienelactone hydrolase